jgi:hypothetical protein
MTEQELQSLTAIAAEHCPAMAEAIECAVEMPPTEPHPVLFAVNRPDRVTLYHVPCKEIARDLVECMCDLGFIVHYGPDIVPVDGEFTVSIRRRSDLQVDCPSTGKCYHVTTRANADAILANGLVAGISAGKASHNSKFADSQHYIHLAPTVEAATEWRRILRLPEDAVILEVDISCNSFQLLRDPCQPDIALIADTPAIPAAALRIVGSVDG